MQSIVTRRGIAALVVIALAVGAALPSIGDAARSLVGTAQLRNGAVTNAKVRAGSLRYTAFAKGQVAPASLEGIRAGGVLTGAYPRPGLANGSVKAGQIATGAVGRSEIAAGAVGSEELAAGAVRAVDIANGSIGAAKLAPNSIGAGQIAPGGVGASEIARGAVGVGELAALPGARVYRSAPTSIPNDVVVEVPMTDAAYNQSSVWSAGQPTQLTAPVDGTYIISGGVAFEASGSGTRAAWLVPAGSPESPYTGEVTDDVRNQPGDAAQFSLSSVVHLNAGESVALAVRQRSGNSLRILAPGQQTSLTLQYLSP